MSDFNLQIWKINIFSKLNLFDSHSFCESDILKFTRNSKEYLMFYSIEWLESNLQEKFSLFDLDFNRIIQKKTFMRLDILDSVKTNYDISDLGHIFYSTSNNNKFSLFCLDFFKNDEPVLIMEFDQKIIKVKCQTISKGISK